MGKKIPISVPFVFMILLCVASMSCRKESFLPVSGLIKDPNQSIPVDNVKVELWTQQIEGGIFTANYVLAGSLITSPDGKFLFNLEKKSFTGIRLIFTKQGYHSLESQLDLEKVKSDQGYYVEYQLFPKASLQIRIKNKEPLNSMDYFEFRILNGYTSCEECCKGELFQFSGMNVDQTIFCQTAGHQDILIQWSKRKNGEQIFKTDHFFIKAFETNLIEFYY